MAISFLNAFVPFAAATCFRACEIEKTGAGVGIDDAESCRFCTQIVQDPAKNGVFEHVGKIAGMEFVMIVQIDLSLRAKFDDRPA